MQHGTANDAARLQEEDFDVEALLCQIESTPADIGALSEACARLHKQISLNRAVLERVDKARALTVLMRVMKVHPQAAGVQGPLLAMVFQLIHNCAPNREEFL